MSDDMDSRMKMLGFNPTRRFFPYDEGREMGEVFLMMAPTGDDQASFCDDMDLFDMDAEGEDSLIRTERYSFEDGLGSIYDEELTSPIKHYIKEMGSSGLLTREGEKEIAVRIEEAKEEIKNVLLSYPGTVRELLNVYSSLKMSELSLSEIATDAEDEEGMGEEGAQRERIVRLLEALKQVHNRLKRAENKEEKDRCRAEMRQIVGDIRFSRKLVERIKGRMQTSVERIERVEREIERLGQEKIRPSLAISLNASSDDQRDALMPINRKYPLAVLLDACRRYPLRPREYFTMEYVLIGGVNDFPEDARRVVRLLAHLRTKVNLIPWNPGNLPYRAPNADSIEEFKRILLEKGVPAFVRYSRGQDVFAACGQLALIETANPLTTLQ